MMKKGFNSMVKVSVCALFAMSLCFVHSCKKSPSAGWVPIDIKLPKPMFVGTPQDTRVPNLEKPLGKARPPFLAPAGTCQSSASSKCSPTETRKPLTAAMLS